MSKYVYFFGGGTADGDGKMKELLGGKGADLAEMCTSASRFRPDSPSPRKSATSSSTTRTSRGSGRSDRRPWRSWKSAWGRSSAIRRTRCC